MFKGIVIELTGPLCTCAEQALAWGPILKRTADGKTAYGLQVSCKTCGTTLEVPNEKFVASFDLDVAYPGKAAATGTPKPNLRGVDGGKAGKVLDFPPGDDTDGSSGP